MSATPEWRRKISDLFGWDQDEDELKRKLMLEYHGNPLLGKLRGDTPDGGEGTWNTDLFNTMKSTEQSRSLGKRQKLFDIAAEGGAQSGGTAVAGGGTTGLDYVAQRDITKTFPGAMSKEEEDYLLALRGPVPGMMTYRGMS